MRIFSKIFMILVFTVSLSCQNPETVIPAEEILGPGHPSLSEIHDSVSIGQLTGTTSLILFPSGIFESEDISYEDIVIQIRINGLIVREEIVASDFEKENGDVAFSFSPLQDEDELKFLIHFSDLKIETYVGTVSREQVQAATFFIDGI